MSERDQVIGVVIAHGSMAEGLVDAVRRIAGGAADALTPMTNEGMGPAELVASIDDAAKSGPVVVFVDLQTGSCGAAASQSCRGQARRAVVSGVNLPMLLDFVFHRSDPFDELVERMVSRGREAITTTSPPRA